MAYEDKYGITEIRETKMDALSVSVDSYQDAEDGPEYPIAVLLHVPHMDDHEHSHIPLDVAQAEVLHEWLGKFIKEHKK